MRKSVLCLLLVTTLCAVGVSARAFLEGEEVAPPLDADSDAALTLQDFAYFTDFQFITDDGYQRECRSPGPEVVKQRFDEPDSAEEEAGYVWMHYPFGWILLDRRVDTLTCYGIEVLINVDGLEGPRGLRIGDSVEALLAAFHNGDTGLPMRTDEEGTIILFHVETDEGATLQYAYAVYLGGDPSEELIAIEYGVVYKDALSCIVSFEVGGGVISQIRWRVGDYQY